jgi:glycosyltransferase involved in cell wall biosynthesis
LRISGAGTTTVTRLMWGYSTSEPAEFLGNAQILLLTNKYPEYSDLYRNGFVHSRVKGYLRHGLKVDVFCLDPFKDVSFYEFQNVDVTKGDAKALRRFIASGRYNNVLVHFLSTEMWDVLEQFPLLGKTIWIHGAEIQPWYRREFNFDNELSRVSAQVKSERRMTFWRNLLCEMPRNLHLVFVSRYFSEEVIEDLQLHLPEGTYSIIHNPIDTNFFSYEPKPIEQRKKILSISSYASRKYANDLSVNAIFELSKERFFNELQFRIIGDGTLFDETVASLKEFRNISIERRFLLKEEIAELHKEYGILLIPTRWDSHGVTRDEAMASGLVPVTCAVAAVPEFVDETCGFLAKAEDAKGLAAGIAQLYQNPDQFLRLSANAAARVRSQSTEDVVIDKEMDLFSRQ